MSSSHNMSTSNHLSAYAAISEAQKIAFAPVTFQACYAMRECGLLSALYEAGRKGSCSDDLVESTGVSRYGVQLMLDFAVTLNVAELKHERYFLGKVGYYLLKDPMTRVNMDFVQDVCYLGMFKVLDSLQAGKPEGLKHFGDWPTVYEGLASLPEQAKKSWFNFDHYYSDVAFNHALPFVFKNAPKVLLDIGGNTGRWASKCLSYNSEVKVVIVDLPGQLDVAQKNLSQVAGSERVSFQFLNLLKPEGRQLAQEADAVWMSQFLDCFSESEILAILQLTVKTLQHHGEVFILESYWDRQNGHQAAEFSLHATSFYFTAIANGNSRMYHSAVMIRLIEKAGLKVTEILDIAGTTSTVFRCRLNPSEI